MRLRPNFPISPARFPFFYGYWIVVVATLGVLASIPGQTVGVSVFNDALIEATGLSRLSISNAYMAGTLVSGLLLPWGGTLLDRHGARKTALWAAVGLAVTLFVLSNIDRLPGTSSWILQVIFLIVAFFFLRFSGQGMLTMVSRTMLGRWFNRKRGLAAGVSGLFVGYGFGDAPRLLNNWVENVGWRVAWQQMGLVVFLGMGTIIWLFYRNDPESSGLTMDGAPAAKDAEQKLSEKNVTRNEAIQTLAFWTVTLALTFQALVVTGVTFHIVDLAAKVGLGRDAALEIFLPIAFVSVVVGLLGGVLADRVRIRSLVILMMLGQALAIYAAMDVAHRPTLLIVGLGLSGGLFGPLSTVAFPRFFGRLHLGAIAGVEMMCLVIGSAVGPSLLATSERVFGSYSPGLWASMVLPFIAIGCALVLREPAPEPAPKRAS